MFPSCCPLSRSRKMVSSYKRGIITDGCWHSSTGISPPHGSHAALLVACDAFNARTATTREYHCPACMLSPASCHACITAWCWSLRFLRRESIMAHPPPGSVQTECVRLPYAAPPLSCVAFFIKVQPCGLRGSGKRGKGKAVSSGRGPCHQVVMTME